MRPSLLLAVALTLLHGHLSEATRKILALHGGGESADGMRFGTADLRTALGAEYEFVYASIASSASQGETWWADPPGGKGLHTTNRDHAAAMVAALNAIVEAQGPFYGIMGYSQGSAAVPVYLSQTATGTFQAAIMFCGYLPTTHDGLIARITETAPFGDIRALVWMGNADSVITNPMSVGQASKFTSPSMIADAAGGHAVPTSSMSTFNAVVSWIRDPTTTVITGTPSTSAVPGDGGGKTGGTGTKSGSTGAKDTTSGAAARIQVNLFAALVGIAALSVFSML